MEGDANRPGKTPSYAGLKPSSEAASRAKRANTKTDTRHEVLFRKALWHMGLRYRKHSAELPGKPDVVISRERVAIFCDGDFWHGRDWESLQAKLQKRHNADYWIAKIARNRARDAAQTAELEQRGWMVIRVWETDVIRDPGAMAKSVLEAITQRRVQAGVIAAPKSPPA